MRVAQEKILGFGARYGGDEVMLVGVDCFVAALLAMTDLSARNDGAFRLAMTVQARGD